MGKFRRKHFAAAIVLLAALLFVGLLLFFGNSEDAGRLKLPVGDRVPVVATGERHGLILASDGSLWSWGCDFLGWPVLAQTNAHKSQSLRRIGRDTNWASISVSDSRNLALKSDGTLWTWGMNVAFHLQAPPMFAQPVQAAPGNDWRQGAAGGNVFVALKRDGTLWGWGNNWSGSAGIGKTKGTATPTQIGAATNWVRVWAGLLETVGMQSDGSLWYWGENPNPAYAQQTNQIFEPARVNADTNWADVSFGVNTMFAIKSDGTLWAWGRHAEVYTRANDTALDAAPVQVGTNTDWRSFTACAGWWITGLTKKDGSLWMMDASEHKANGPGTPAPPPVFQRIDFEKDIAACTAGSVHAEAPGVHGPIGVVLTRDGEVWTRGVVLGDPASPGFEIEKAAARALHWFNPKIGTPDTPPVHRNKPWQLRNVDPGE